ncbi:MAG: alpha-L-fucosidase, partial [Armatimonadota bacterium]
MSKPWYQNGYRRMLVDMHIVDWEEEFLSKYDPEFMAEMYSRANLTSAMFYCQSHVGLCYWSTKSGKMHAGLKGRDIVGELHEALKARGIASVAYYSLIFNNWAFLEHPEWRI